MSTFLLEAEDIYRVNNLVAKYNITPDKIILQAPSTYSESDLQIYMGDKWFNDLPASSTYSDKFFGQNALNISDVYFEYDGFERTEIEPKIDFYEYDMNYDKNISDNIELSFFIFKNLKYYINFEQFDLTETNDSNVDKNLKDIFRVTSSNNINKYPFKLQFDENDLQYMK